MKRHTDDDTTPQTPYDVLCELLVKALTRGLWIGAIASVLVMLVALALSGTPGPRP